MVDFKCLKELHVDVETFCETWEKLLQKQSLLLIFILWMATYSKETNCALHICLYEKRLLGIYMEMDLLAIWGVTRLWLEWRRGITGHNLKSDVARKSCSQMSCLSSRTMAISKYRIIYAFIHSQEYFVGPNNGICVRTSKDSKGI